MKKLFALALAALSTVSMFAAINSQLTIYLDSESKEVEARIAAGDTYSPFDAGVSASYVPMYSNPSNIGLYVQYAGGNFMELNAPELVNVPLVVVTSREASAKQNYTFYAEAGVNHSVAVSVTDLRPDGGGAPVTFELNDLTDYSFTLKDEAAYVEGENSVIADRFVINYDPSVVITVTTNEEGWASFAHSVNVVPLDNSLKIYTGDVNGDVLTLSEVGYVKASEGVIVKGAANTTYEFMQGTAAGDFSANDLIGCPVATSVLSGTNFVLSYLNGVTAFYQYTGSEIPAHKAYLNFPAASPAPKHIRMVINDVTAIDNVEVETVKAEKFVEDGQVYIRRGNEVYNLQGQKVNF